MRVSGGLLTDSTPSSVSLQNGTPPLGLWTATILPKSFRHASSIFAFVPSVFNKIATTLTVIFSGFHHYRKILWYSTNASLTFSYIRCSPVTDISTNCQLLLWMIITIKYCLWATNLRPSNLFFSHQDGFVLFQYILFFFLSIPTNI